MSPKTHKLKIVNLRQKVGGPHTKEYSLLQTIFLYIYRSPITQNERSELQISR